MENKTAADPYYPSEVMTMFMAHPNSTTNPTSPVFVLSTSSNVSDCGSDNNTEMSVARVSLDEASTQFAVARCTRNILILRMVFVA